MTQRIDVQSMLGATLWLSATRPLTNDLAGMSDTDIVWTKVGKVENFGDYGVEAQIIEFVPVETGVKAKLKGAKDYGTMNLTLGNVPVDTGQALIEVASESQNRYSARIIYPLGDGEVMPEVHYFDVLVGSKKLQNGAVNDVRKAMVTLCLCQKPVIQAAT